MSAWALSQIGDAAAMPAVVEALRAETNEEVRQAEARVLIESGTAPDDVVRTLVESKNPKTREMAVRALAGRKAPWPWPWPQPRPRPFP
jgi:HEAT repeat protein